MDIRYGLGNLHGRKLGWKVRLHCSLFIWIGNNKSTEGEGTLYRVNQFPWIDRLL